MAYTPQEVYQIGYRFGQDNAHDHADPGFAETDEVAQAAAAWTAALNDIATTVGDVGDSLALSIYQGYQDGVAAFQASLGSTPLPAADDPAPCELSADQLNNALDYYNKLQTQYSTRIAADFQAIDDARANLQAVVNNNANQALLSVPGYVGDVLNLAGDTLALALPEGAQEVYGIYTRIRDGALFLADFNHNNKEYTNIGFQVGATHPSVPVGGLIDLGQWVASVTADFATTLFGASLSTTVTQANVLIDAGQVGAKTKEMIDLFNEDSDSVRLATSNLEQLTHYLSDDRETQQAAIKEAYDNYNALIQTAYRGCIGQLSLNPDGSVSVNGMPSSTKIDYSEEPDYDLTIGTLPATPDSPAPTRELLVPDDQGEVITPLAFPEETTPDAPPEPNSSFSTLGILEYPVLNLGGNLIAGTENNDTISATTSASFIFGGAGDDTITTGDANDVVIGGPGDDVIDMGGGFDIAVYSGSRSQYKIETYGNVLRVTDTVANRDGTDLLRDVEGLRFSDGPVLVPSTNATLSAALSQLTGLQTAPTPSPSGLIGSLNFSQQLEMIYFAYFDRGADGAGFNFWQGQNAEALAAGQSTGQVLANIADAFTPQPETFALDPFLSTLNVNLESPASSAALTNVVTAIYGNLFDRAPDAAGLAYWVHQLSTGAIPLGEAILAIANGALGSDVTEIMNKITVALDFTTRTEAAGLGLTNIPASFLPAARSVLSGVDSTSLNDASVTAGKNATTAYIASAAPTSANDPIVSTSDTVIDPGAGSHSIQFIAGASTDTVVLHSGGTDQIAGFDLTGGDVLDVRTLIVEAQLTPQDVLPNLGAYFSVVDQGTNAVLLFDSTGHGGGNAVAILNNLGSLVTSFSSLTSHNAVQT